MIDDFVRAHGYLTLGTRLKRLGERMQTEVAEVSTALGMPTAPGLLTALYAIEANDELPVSGLAEALGVSQPAATKLAGRLFKSGLVTLKRDPADKRARILAATPAGIALIRTGQAAFWPAVDAAVHDLCEDVPRSLLESVDAIEAGLALMPLSERIRQKLKHGEKDDNAP